MLNTLRYCINRIRFFNEPEKFIEHLYNMKREDVSIPIRMPLGRIIMFTPDKEVKWPPESGSELDKQIRMSLLQDFIVS